MDNVTSQAEQSRKRECLMVLSMHRSGGSLLAACLHHLGVNLGKNLFTENQTNGDDGVENQDIVLLHEILFRDLGFRWDMAGNLPNGWMESEATQRAEKKLTQIIEENFLNDPLWAVKDPRLCRFMPLWFRVLYNLDIAPKFIHLIRHPYEVAGSLSHCFKTSFSKGHLLWMVYNRDAWQTIAKQSYSLMSYDQLLADPVSALLKIADTLDIEFPCDPIKYSHLLTDVARSDLKHHHTSRGSDCTSFSQYEWVYKQQVKAIEARTGYHADFDSESLSDFPIISIPGATVQNREAHNHAHSMFNNLLDVIGRYEQDELYQNLKRQRQLLAATHAAEVLFAQLYYPDYDESHNSYSDENSIKILLAPAEWQSISWDIRRPQDLRTGSLRLDPLNTRGAVSISNMQLIDVVTNEIYWSAVNREDFEQCTVQGDGLVLSMDQGLTMICTGDDARLKFPLLPKLPDSPMYLKVWIKPSRDQTVLEEAWARLNDDKKELNRKILNTEEQLQLIQQQLKEKESELHNSKIHAVRIEELEKQLKAKENLAMQYYEALLDTEKEHQDQVENIRTQLLKKQEALKDIEKHLQYQEHLTSQYHSALLAAESEQQDNIRLKDQNAQLNAWMDKLNKAFNALAASRRWKFGYGAGRALEIMRMRSKQPTALDQIDDIFNRYAKANLTTSAMLITKNADNYYQDEEFLFNWLKDLKNDFQAFMGSHRWRWGNAVVRFAEILLLRKKAQLAVEHMASIFDDFEHWRQYSLGERSKASLYFEEIKQLKDWLRKLDNAFQATLESRRWRVGNAMVNLFMRLTFRSSRPLVTDHMQEIFNNYREQFQE